MTGDRATPRRSALAVASRGPEQLDVFWVRPDRRVGTDWWMPERVRVHVRVVNLPGESLTGVGSQRRAEAASGLRCQPVPLHFHG
nr:hypothetical protein GCM10010200_094880 [Actinomadura rugatobispora]